MFSFLFYEDNGCSNGVINVRDNGKCIIYSKNVSQIFMKKNCKVRVEALWRVNGYGPTRDKIDSMTFCIDIWVRLVPRWISIIINIIFIYKRIEVIDGKAYNCAIAIAALYIFNTLNK